MPAGNEGNALRAAELYDLLDLGRRAGKDYDCRFLAQMRQRIALVGQKLHRLAQYRRVTADRSQTLHQLIGH